MLFLFSLTNKDNRPLKMKIDSYRHESAIRCHPKFGPIFGRGDDICIADNANTTRKNYSRLGHTYKHPQLPFWAEMKVLICQTKVNRF